LIEGIALKHVNKVEELLDSRSLSFENAVPSEVSDGPWSYVIFNEQDVIE